MRPPHLCPSRLLPVTPSFLKGSFLGHSPNSTSATVSPSYNDPEWVLLASPPTGRKLVRGHTARKQETVEWDGTRAGRACVHTLPHRTTLLQVYLCVKQLFGYRSIHPPSPAFPTFVNLLLRHQPHSHADTHAQRVSTQ